MFPLRTVYYGECSEIKWSQCLSDMFVFLFGSELSLSTDIVLMVKFKSDLRIFGTTKGNFVLYR